MKSTPFILSLAVAAALAGGCRTGGAPASRPPGTKPTEAAFSDKSVYQTESQWNTDTGKRIKLADLSGRPQVVVMFFASCQYACPVLVKNLRNLEASLPMGQRGRVGFTLVSIDPQRDSPAALAKFRTLRKLPKNWALLHGSPDDILELGALLGVKYKEEATGQFAHSNVITVLNAGGEISRQFVGLNQDINEIARTLDQMLSLENATTQ